MIFKALGPAAVLLATLLLMLWEPAARQVEFFPLVVVAMLLSPTVLEWLTGRRHLFDPVGLVMVVWFQVLVVSPAAAFIVDSYGMPMDDTRVLLSKTILWLIPGTVAFLVGMSLPQPQRWGRRAALTVRTLNTSRALWVALVLIAAGAVARYLYLFIAVGRGGTFATRFSATEGLGVVGVVAEMLKVGLLLLVAMSIQRYYNARSAALAKGKFGVIMISLIVLALVMYQVFYRGSRGLILMYMFWMLGMVHFSVKRIRLVYLIVPILLSVEAFHACGLYKSFGMRAFKDYLNPVARQEMEDASGRSKLGLFVGELGRINVWMFAYQEISQGRHPHTWGQTYWEGSVVWIPRAIWPNRPHSMPKVITDMRHGEGTYEAQQERTARVTGMVGEAYINFGWGWVIVMMFLLGVATRWVASWVEHAPNTVAKAFLAPLVILCLMYMIMWDWVWMVFKFVGFLLPIYLVYRFTMPKVQDGEHAGVLSEAVYTEEGVELLGATE